MQIFPVNFLSLIKFSLLQHDNENASGRISATWLFFFLNESHLECSKLVQKLLKIVHSTTKHRREFTRIDKIRPK